MCTFIATYVSIRDCGSTSGSSRYAGTSSARTNPRPYCPRMTFCATIDRSIGRSDRRTLTFSSRTASAASEIGGSIAVRQRSCIRWFSTMSFVTPVCS